MQSNVWRVSATAGLAVMVAVAPNAVHAADKVHIVMRAFIPSTHLSASDVLMPVPGTAGKTMLKAPISGINMCFETDNRLFSSDPRVSARVATDFTVETGDAPVITPALKASRFATGTTRQLDCATGALLKTAQASTDGCAMGAPAYADNQVQVVTECKASNPLVPLAPDIYYGGTFTYHRVNKTLSFKGDVGTFPAFEIYASVNAGRFVKLLASPPGEGAGPLSLIDLWLHMNTRQIDVPATKLAP